jgi:hypothetical protein
MSQKKEKDRKIDFNKLERHALMKLLKYYNLNPKVGATHSELVNLVSKAFDCAHISSEGDVINKFSSTSSTCAEGSKRPKYSREILDSEPARIGEQVKLPNLKLRTRILSSLYDTHPVLGCG